MTERTPSPAGAPVGAAMLAFLRRQQRDWVVTVVRTSLDRLAYQMVFPYLSIYIIALGATATQLGLVNSLGMLVAGLAGPFTGWLIDRHGPRSFYLAGIALLAVAYLTYALAQSWPITILAMMAWWLGYSISGHSCATICGNCLANPDRATGMTICETVAAGLLGIVGPILGTVIVVSSGAVDADAIRPLFVVAFAITVGTFLFILTQLSGQRWGARGTGRAVFRDLGEVLSEGRYLKRWLVIAAIGQLPVGMVFAFSSVYAYEVKGADACRAGRHGRRRRGGLHRPGHPAGQDRGPDRAQAGPVRRRSRSSRSPASCSSGHRGRSPCCSPERSSRSTTSAGRSARRWNGSSCPPRTWAAGSGSRGS